jgi:hypothetical protein
MEVTINKCRFTLRWRIMSKFVGRQAELSRLVETMRKKSAAFVIVKGRRRVGKSRLDACSAAIRVAAFRSIYGSSDSPGSLLETTPGT